MVFTQQLVNGLMLGSIYISVAMTFTLTIGILNFLNFTIPALYMLAGMVGWSGGRTHPWLQVRHQVVQRGANEECGREGWPSVDLCGCLHMAVLHRRRGAQQLWSPA